MDFETNVVEPDFATPAQAENTRYIESADKQVRATLQAASMDMLLTDDNYLLARDRQFAILIPTEFCACYAP